MRPAAVLPALVALAGAAPAVAAPDPGFLISADTSRIGRIDLYFGDVQGTHGTFYELVGGRRIKVADVTVTGTTPARVLGALTWSCRRLTRRIVADAVRPDGSTATARYAVRTPSCEDRLRLQAPRAAPPGARVPVTVVDRWRLGDVGPLFCVRSPAGSRACRYVRFGGRARAQLRVAVARDGAWALSLALGLVHVRRTLDVGLAPDPRRPAARPVVLATGDSTIQGIDAYLADRLRRSARVVSDFRPGSAISQESDRWPAFARTVTRRYRQRVTVASVGAADGWPIGEILCCGPAWRAAYERRLRQVMTTFARGGAGRVLWLTLPRPRDPRRARVSAAVNAVIERAGPAVRGVTVVRIDRVISPGWRFRRTLRYHGRPRVVRADDGIHLSLAGASIATDLVLRALSRGQW